MPFWRGWFGMVDDVHGLRFPNFVDYTVVNYTVLSQDVTITRNRTHTHAHTHRRRSGVSNRCVWREQAMRTYSNSSASLDDALCHIICFASDRRLLGSFVSVPSLEFIRGDLLRSTARAMQWQMSLSNVRASRGSVHGK